MISDVTDETFALRAIGIVRSGLRDRDRAPSQGNEGAPAASIELDRSLIVGLRGMSVGDELVIVTWLHRSRRDVLELHPRWDETLPLTGVFATRSPDRPNPLGLHRVTVREIAGSTIVVEPLEAIDGTPVVDIKPVLRLVDDS
jgi:tRNA-Thr(GGU) m(6)t(6)A37 methyltransferase TsaA